MTDVKLPGVGDKDPVRITKAIRDIAGPRNYLEFNSMATAPEAPRSGARIYFDDEDQAYVKTSDSVAAPYIFPTWYTGNITIPDNTGFWERRFNRHAGDGIITLGDGDYIASGVIEPQSSRLDIRAENVGAAMIQARWTVSSCFVRLFDMDLQPQDEGVYLFNIRNGYLDARDIVCDVSAYNDIMPYLFAFTESSMTMIASARDCEFITGNNADSFVFLFDGSNFKWSGTVSTKRNKITTTNGAYGILAYGSKGVLTGTHFYGPGSGDGMLLGRVSTCAMSQDMVFDNFSRGLRTNQESTATFTDDANPYGAQKVTVSNCTIGLYRDSGRISYEDGAITFTSNTTNETDVAKTMRYVGVNESVSQINLSSGPTTVAAGATVYVGVGHAGATENEFRIPINEACRVIGIRHVAGALAGASQTYVVTLRKNGVDTSLAATTNNSTFGSDTTAADGVDFAVGDYLTVKIVASAGATVQSHTVAISRKMI